MQKTYISIDLGGTKCAGAVVTEAGEIMYKMKDKISGLKGTEVSDAIYSIILQLKKKLPSGHSLQGVGVSVPGISNQRNGTVWAPNIPGWDHYPLLTYLEEKLDNEMIIHIDSDRACCICGEVWQGVAKGFKNAIFLAFGTGIGAGIIVDNRILRGNNDIAGAIGWLALDHQYPEGYKQFGCFEYNASGDGLVRLANDIFNKVQPNTSLDIPNLRAEDIFSAHEINDALAIATIDIAIDYWAKGVANLVSIFNPEIIIFGGGVFGPGLKFLDQIYEKSRKWAQPIAIQEVKLAGGQLGVDAQLFGAAKLVMEKELK
jgi:glucokinase